MNKPTQKETLDLLDKAGFGGIITDCNLELFSHLISLARQRPGWKWVPEAQLKHWSEYWNGNENERAMSDALDHILGEIDELLAAAPSPGDAE